MANPALNQHAFCFYQDDSSDPDTCTIISGGSVNATDMEYPLDTNLMVRLGLENTDNDADTASIRLNYQVNSTSGSWTPVTGSSNYVRMVSGTPSDGTACDTQLLTDGPALGNWVAGGSFDRGDGMALASWDKMEFFECQWSVTLRSADLSPSDVVYFWVDTYAGTVDFDTPPTRYGQITVASGVEQASADDGFEMSDAAVAETTQREALTDGFDVGEDITTTTIETFEGEVVELSDSVVGVETYPESVTDGAEFSDTPTTEVSYGVSVASGVEFSEAIVTQLDVVSALSDGVELSDSAVETTKEQEEVSDTAEFSDVAVGHSTEKVSVDDGVEFSDEAVGVLVSTQAFAVDGFEMSDDTTAIIKEVVSVFDGFEFSEDMDTITYELWSGDGFVFSEIVEGDTDVEYASVSDTFEFSEDIDTVTYELWEGDGAVFSDSLTGTTSEPETALAEDGLVFSEDMDVGVEEVFNDEVAVFSDQVTTRIDASVSVSEVAVFSDGAVGAIPATTASAEDGITFSDLAVTQLTESLEDGGVFSDEVDLLVIFEVSDTTVFSDAATGEVVGVESASAYDGVSFSEVVTGATTKYGAASDEVVLSDELDLGIQSALEDGVAFSEVVSGVRKASASQSDGFLMDDTVETRMDVHVYPQSKFKFSEDISLVINGVPVVEGAFGITDITTVDRPSQRG